MCHKCIAHLKENLKKAVDERGVTEDKSLHEDLTTIMTKNHMAMSESFPAGSFARIFWGSQQQASSLQDA